MTTFKFTVAKTIFEIAAETKLKAMEAANNKIRAERLVPIDFSFAWFDSTKPNEFYLAEYSCFD
jgi:hypothetical protein